MSLTLPSRARLLVSSLAAILCAMCAPAAVAQTLPGPAIGKPAPDFALKTVDGKTVRLSDYRGKTLVLNVWGSWCPPCRLETPDLIAEAHAQSAHGVAFLGVDTTEPASVVRTYDAAKGIPYPQAAVPDNGPFATAYDIRNYPITFVVGPDGILRARHADNILPRAQLHAYIVAAQHGESATVTSPFQAQLDALLAPSNYPFTGDPATVRANIAKAVAAIGQADDLQDEAMNDLGRDHDLIKTQGEQETLRAAAITALAPIAAGDADTALLARLRGDEDVAFGRWREADAAYADALAHAPNEVDALGGQAYAASKLGDDARVAAIDAQIAQRSPSAPTFVGLGRAEAKRGNLTAAESAFERAQQLATEPRVLAWTNLYFGRMEAEAGNREKARAAFVRAAAAAEQIPTGDPRHAWYVEQAQEGEVALDVARGKGAALSLAPWTGPDLPGSVESTIKYRLVVTDAPGAHVGLAAAGLPQHWIGSFCTDRVCAPFRTSIVMPADGVKIIEFQVVPTTPHAGPVRVRIDANHAGHAAATVATVVRV
ncbi:MAG TPA: TlpA disulfide reductase family protein [Candidatus Elarobacter sp.]|nr:TlpA disulfide reductase family protein [Candidatus Elarobacter sp.]